MNLNSKNLIRLITATSIVALLGIVGVTGQGAVAAGRLEYREHKACAAPTPGHATCLAISRTSYRNGIVQHGLGPLIGTSFGAHALRRAYGINTVGARYKVIAIVDAMHSATAFDDVNGYRKMYSLPPLANCGSASGGNSATMSGAPVTELPSGTDPCFIQLGQDGLSAISVQTTDNGWAQEIALDIEMASAVCPHCSILLVEAKTNSFRDLKQAVSIAANFKGTIAISNSYGGRDVPESADSPYAAATASGIAVVASSGDSGYGVSAPASFASVIGVGGTSLKTDAGFRWLGETAWNKGGSGCSSLNPAADWQDQQITGCSGKAVVDVAAVADPATGVTVYFDGEWYSFGGTSAAAPIVAALFAMKANFGASAGAYLWANHSQLRDVTDGSNGVCATPLFCIAGSGFDGPTGWGTPQGAGAF